MTLKIYLFILLIDIVVTAILNLSFPPKSEQILPWIQDITSLAVMTAIVGLSYNWLSNKKHVSS